MSSTSSSSSPSGSRREFNIARLLETSTSSDKVQVQGQQDEGEEDVAPLGMLFTPEELLIASSIAQAHMAAALVMCCSSSLLLPPTTTSPPMTHSSTPTSSTMEEASASPEPREHGNTREPGTPCVVCGDFGTSQLHYGVKACHGCAIFFRRKVRAIQSQSAGERQKARCRRGGRCPIDEASRNNCHHCRYLKCLQVGMTVHRVGRPRSTINKAKKSLKEVGKEKAPVNQSDEAGFDQFQEIFDYCRQNLSTFDRLTK